MNIRNIRTTVPVASLVLFSLLCVPSLRAAEMVDNPRYAAWAKYKPGSNVSVTQELGGGNGGKGMTNLIIERLLDVTPEKAMVEYAITLQMGSAKHTSKRNVDIPAKVEKGHEELAPDVTGTTKEAGSEKVTIGEKTYDCKIIEFTGESKRGKASGKVWKTPEIPGGVAKTETHLEGPRPTTMTMTVTAVDIKS